MDQVMLDVHDLHFAWGAHRVLDGMDVQVPRGAIMCLMGANGCGKSTFLDCILGENRFDRGSVKVAGYDVSTLRAQERARLLSYVPQVHERTFPYTVEHVVLMGRTAHLNGFDVPDDEDRELAFEAMRACGIDRLYGRPCTQISGGEMQMTLLARALAQDTPLILLDEPTAHLDFRNELLFLETVERLAGLEKTTIFMATHSPNQAFHLSAAGLDVTVGVMAHGRMAKVGTPDEVLTAETFKRNFGVCSCVTDVDDADIVASGFTGGSKAGLVGMRQVVALRTVDTSKDADETISDGLGADDRYDGLASALEEE